MSLEPTGWLFGKAMKYMADVLGLRMFLPSYGHKLKELMKQMNMAFTYSPVPAHLKRGPNKGVRIRTACEEQGHNVKLDIYSAINYIYIGLAL